MTDEALIGSFSASPLSEGDGTGKKYEISVNQSILRGLPGVSNVFQVFLIMREHNRSIKNLSGGNKRMKYRNVDLPAS